MNNVLPIFGAEEDPQQAASQEFLDKLSAITSIKLICQLTKSVQQHRGATMGYISGEQAFMSIAQQQSQVIDKLFTGYLLHNRFEQQSAAPMEVSHSLDSWNVIKFDWQTDELLQNFEFHSHLIDSLKKMIRRHMRDNLMSTDQSAEVNHGRLLETVFITLPNTTEALAMLRGLSTNAAVVQACGRDSHMRLSYLIKDIPRLILALEQALDLLVEDYPEVEQLKPGRGLQRRLNALLRKINSNILNSRKIQEDSTQLFKVATEIIDAFWSAIDRGVQLVEQQVYDEFIAG